MSSSSSKALTFVRKVWTSFLSSSGMEPHLLSSLTITAASPGRVSATLEIASTHLNRLSILHGGVIACLVDTGGSLAVASRGLYSTGVSTDLNVTYVRAGGRVGQSLRCEFTCDSLGQTMAYTRAEFFEDGNGDGNVGRCVARGSHTKFVGIAQQHELNITDQLRPEGSNDAAAKKKKQGSGKEGWTVPL